MSDQTNILRLVADRLRAARRVVVVTGAGVSAESGLRTFRGATAADMPTDMQALWREFDPMKLATPEAFDADPEMVTRWYDWRRLGCLAAEPNPGHSALAAMERHIASRGGDFALFTQNVDRLHHRAGSQRVFELHGSIIEWRCVETGETFEPEPTPFERFPPPSPFHPGALLRPNVVWFGEALPESVLLAAFDLAPKADLFFTIGTSSVVYPAAAFVEMAAREGAFTVEVNKDDTAATTRVDAVLRGPSGEILPRLVELAFDA